MLVGDELMFGQGWRLVEADLYDITGRVREYDADARLVVSDDGELGLARRCRTFAGVDGAVVFARPCVDWAAGVSPLPALRGVPDARVLWDQRVSDAHRIVDMRAWTRRRRDMLERREARRRRERLEWSEPYADEFAFLASRVDMGHKPSIRVPRGVA